MIDRGEKTRGSAGWIVGAILLLGAAAGWARPVAPPQVTTAVETWVQDALTKGRPGARVVDLQPFPDAGEPAGYIAHLAGGGFCLAGADDRLLPVYLYSPEGEFDADHPGLGYFLREIGDRLDNLLRAEAAGDLWLNEVSDELTVRAAAWNDLAAGAISIRTSAIAADSNPARLELPMRSTWGQGTPYNNDVAVLPGYGLTAAGCVAISLSQLLYYWRWPVTGESTHTRTWEYRTSSVWLSTALAADPGIDDAKWGERLRWTDYSGGYLQMTGNWDKSTFWLLKGDPLANPLYAAAMDNLFDRMTPVFVDHTASFGTTNYGWNQMVDNHQDPAAAGPAGDAAVAELIHHAGISVNMLWGVQESYAGSVDIPAALNDYFRYDPDAVYGPLSAQTLIDEIQWHRPIPVEGQVPPGDGGGHSWLVFGYDQSPPTGPVFLMNLGYDGPGVWLAFDLVNKSYGQVSMAAPEGVVRFVGGGVTGDGSPDQPYASLDAALGSAPDHTTLVFHAGSEHSAGGSLTVERPLVLLGEGVVIR